MGGDTTQQPASRCPICGRPSAESVHPFCSKRCADVDLQRWLGGVYAIPGEEGEDLVPPADGGKHPRES